MSIRRLLAATLIGTVVGFVVAMAIAMPLYYLLDVRGQFFYLSLGAVCSFVCTQAAISKAEKR